MVVRELNAATLVKELNALKALPLKSNADIIKVHATCELLKIDLEHYLAELSKSEVKDGDDHMGKKKIDSDQCSVSSSKIELEAILVDLETFSQSLKLNYAYNEPISPISRLDEILRIICVLLFLVSSSFYIALPCILLKPIERMMVEFGVMRSDALVTVALRRWTAWTLVKLAGIHLEVQGESYTTTGKQASLVCFSHVSTLDGFLTATSINAPQVSMVKYELLFIPFFSWHVLAFGGIPLNRRKRSQAVAAMAEGVSRTSPRDVIAVAPEGTRSTTGLLLPFKKGPFHVWQQLDCAPIVSIVNFGAFELYPPHCLFTMPGKVYIRFLPSVVTEEAEKPSSRALKLTDGESHAARDAMSVRIRKDMLKSMLNVPSDAGAPLTAKQRLENIGAMFVCLLWHYFLWSIIPFRAIKHSFGLTRLQVYLLIIFGSFAITVTVYVYLYYVTHWIAVAYKSLFASAKKKKTEREHDSKSLPASVVNVDSKKTK